jgi:hypothetical protein
VSTREKERKAATRVKMCVCVCACVCVGGGDGRCALATNGERRRSVGRRVVEQENGKMAKSGGGREGGTVTGDTATQTSKKVVTPLTQALPVTSARSILVTGVVTRIVMMLVSFLQTLSSHPEPHTWFSDAETDRDAL